MPAQPPPGEGAVRIQAAVHVDPHRSGLERPRDAVGAAAVAPRGGGGPCWPRSVPPACPPPPPTPPHPPPPPQNALRGVPRWSCARGVEARGRAEEAVGSPAALRPPPNRKRPRVTSSHWS